MEYMTTAAEFAGMTAREIRDWIRELRAEYRSEKSRRHMASEANLALGRKQHAAAVEALRMLS
jgi:hypothetical protein